MSYSTFAWSQQLLGNLDDRPPCERDVTGLSARAADGEAEEVDALLLRGDHVNSTVVVDSLHEFSVRFVRLVLKEQQNGSASMIDIHADVIILSWFMYFQTEADEAHDDVMRHFESRVTSHESLELFGEIHVLEREFDLETSQHIL